MNDAVAPLTVDEKPVQKSYGQNHHSTNGASLSTRRVSSGATPVSIRPNNKPSHKTHKHDIFPYEDRFEDDVNDEQVEIDEAEDQYPQANDEQQSPGADEFDDDDKQSTIEMRNLPERCTHLDITKSIRGGTLVQIFMRFTERVARVTFVDAAAACEFLARGKRVGFSIHNKKVYPFNTPKYGISDTDDSRIGRPILEWPSIHRPPLHQTIHHPQRRNPQSNYQEHKFQHHARSDSWAPGPHPQPDRHKHQSRPHEPQHLHMHEFSTQCNVCAVLYEIPGSV